MIEPKYKVEFQLILPDGRGFELERKTPLSYHTRGEADEFAVSLRKTFGEYQSVTVTTVNEFDVKNPRDRTEMLQTVVIPNQELIKQCYLKVILHKVH